MRRLLCVLLLAAGCSGGGDGHADAGLAHARAGDYPAAAAAFETALESDPADLKALYNLGLLRQLQQQPGEAAALFERFVVLRPDDAEGHYELGRARAAEGRADDAIAALQRAVELGFADHAALASPEFQAIRGEVPFVMLEVTVAQRSGVRSERAAGEYTDPSTPPPPRIRPPRSDDPSCDPGALTLNPVLPDE